MVDGNREYGTSRGAAGGDDGATAYHYYHHPQLKASQYVISSISTSGSA